MYMAANIGANDLANAMGTSVGSRAITLKQAVLISVIANLLGAVLAGTHVTETLRKGIIDPNLLAGAPEKFMLGMFAALLAAGIWVHLATILAQPVSTSHSIVGAVVGFGAVSVGLGAIKWGKVTSIVLSWLVSPVCGGLVAGGMYILIKRKILQSRSPGEAAIRYAPFLVFLVFVVLTLSLIYKGLKNLHLDFSFWNAFALALVVGVIAAITSRYIFRCVDFESRECKFVIGEGGHLVTESLFAYLQILTACYVAFAHGANDVANAVGPLAAIFAVVKTKTVAAQVQVPLWMLAIGGIAVGGGLFAFGTRVMETIGKNITEITPVRGFCAEFGAATTILVCSRMGLPISTTHVLVGSVVGIGLVRGMEALDLRLVKNILISWFITLPFTMILAIIIYELMLHTFY
ncbi:MAG: phosphate permease [Deltaproteobacteria bacterium]|nr:MAG: phosphate permease [Deltaproteobacteria bacterium]RLB10074.1 MAG: phosphate permease [Deltaproteobacteria bacterium]